MILTIIKDRLTAPSVQFYRTSGVFKHIAGLTIKEVSYPEALSTDNWAWETDAILPERFFTPEGLAVIRKAKAYNLKVVLDDDDDRLNIPDYMPLTTLSYYADPNFKDRLASALQAADLIFVSTDALAKSYQRLTRSKICIARNAVNDYIWPEPQQPRADAGESVMPLIAWRGSDKHLADLEATWNAFRISGVQYLFFGTVPGMAGKVAETANFLPFGELWQYFAALRANNPEWLAVPLLNNFFNQAKSDLAYLEATWIGGAAVIAPDYLQEFNHNGVLGYGDKTLTYIIKGIKERKYSAKEYHEAAVDNIKKFRLLSLVNKERGMEVLKLKK